MCYGYDGEGALRRTLESRGVDRRSVLRGMFAGVAGAAALGSTGLGVAAQAAAPAVRPVPPGRISIQLYTLRSIMRGEGVDATIRRLGEIGYQRVELAGYYGRSAADIRGLLDSAGIRASSSHDGISSSDAALEQKLDNAELMGQRFMVVPFLRSENKADWQAWAERMNVEAAAAKDRGIAYGYHNHAHEFTTDLGGGVSPWDVLTGELDPSVAHLEVDLYWAVTGGLGLGMTNQQAIQFAIDTIAAAPQQVRQYHVKDRDVATGSHADLGTGFIDFQRIFDAHQVEEYIVENDTPDVTPIQTAEVGWSYLRDLRF